MWFVTSGRGQGLHCSYTLGDLKKTSRQVKYKACDHAHIPATDIAMLNECVTEAKNQPAQLATPAPAVKCILSDKGGSHAWSLISIKITLLQWESGTVISSALSEEWVVEN